LSVWPESIWPGGQDVGDGEADDDAVADGVGSRAHPWQRLDDSSFLGTLVDGLPVSSTAPS
jgi:hypothetical protein